MLIICCTIAIYVLIWVIYCKQWDLILYISEVCNSLVAGWAFYAIQIVILLCYAMLFVALFKHRELLKKKFIFYAFIVVLFTTFFAQNIFPLFDIYGEINYKTYLSKREEIVQMFKKDEMIKYQINSNTYLLPDDFKTCSYTSRVFCENSVDNLKIIFYVHKGFLGKTAIVYVSNDMSLKEDFFDFAKVKKINSYWYYIRE